MWGCGLYGSGPSTGTSIGSVKEQKFVPVSRNGWGRSLALILDFVVHPSVVMLLYRGVLVLSVGVSPHHPWWARLSVCHGGLPPKPRQTKPLQRLDTSVGTLGSPRPKSRHFSHVGPTQSDVQRTTLPDSRSGRPVLRDNIGAHQWFTSRGRRRPELCQRTVRSRRPQKVRRVKSLPIWLWVSLVGFQGRSYTTIKEGFRNIVLSSPLSILPSPFPFLYPSPYSGSFYTPKPSYLRVKTNALPLNF